MTDLAVVLMLVPITLFVYAYAGYPLLLALVARWKPKPTPLGDPAEWPRISITIPAYNEAAAIGPTLDSLLALDYPADRRQILVVSDCSSDGTDAVVQGYAGRGVELLRLAVRRGKTAAENAAIAHLRGDIVVN